MKLDKAIQEYLNPSISGKFTIGSEIRKLRLEKKMQVNELARLCGIAPVFLTQIEKHDKKCSDGKMLDILRVLFGKVEKDNYIFVVYMRKYYPDIYEVIK